MATVVTVGRNVGDSLDAHPMDTTAWASFREEVLIAVRHFCGTPYFEGVGVGWSEEWGEEDSFTVIGPDLPDWAFWSDFAAELVKVSRYYGQEAVAVTTGKTAFV